MLPLTFFFFHSIRLACNCISYQYFIRTLVIFFFSSHSHLLVSTNALFRSIFSFVSIRATLKNRVCKWCITLFGTWMEKKKRFVARVTFSNLELFCCMIKLMHILEKYSFESALKIWINYYRCGNRSAFSRVLIKNIKFRIHIFIFFLVKQAIKSWLARHLRQNRHAYQTKLALHRFIAIGTGLFVPLFSLSSSLWISPFIVNTI